MLDAQSQQKSHVKWTSLCVEPNAKPLKLFNPQSQSKMPSDSQIHNHFNSERHLVSRETYKQRRSDALAEWRTLAA
jgi:hypothetical protein